MGEKRIKAWHFLPKDKTLCYGDGRKVRAGRTYSYAGKEPPELCVRGVHASERVLDALSYAPGPILCRVEVWGDVQRGDDKLVGRHRKVLWVMDVTPILHEFACRCAERALKQAGVTDKRCWDAIKAKRGWLKGKVTDAQLSAAWDAAWDAWSVWDAAWAVAWAAAWDARDAVRAAAWAAAWDAARAAAWAAAWDARDAARDEQGLLLEKMVRAARRSK